MTDEDLIAMWPVGDFYRTRDGRPAKALAVFPGQNEPIIGARKNRIGEWIPSSWGAGGAWSEGGEGTNDLIRIKPKRTVWLNVYPDSASAHVSRDSADRITKDIGLTRIACKLVEIEDGEGL